MAIKDVSKQWAALMESEVAADEKYTEACEESCEAIKKANEDEIDNFDEEEIDPADCGFAEDEMQVDEVVDPMQMWKDMKKQEAPKKNVKVDAKYIDTMKKLLSKIKSSKAQLYNTVMAKLNAYKAAGTELPPPEDYAENFVPFEMIQKVIGGKEDNAEGHVEGDDDEKMLAGRAYATDRSAAEYGDTQNAFGNADAEANMYDSEITEDEAEDAKKKVDEIIKKELKEKGSIKDMKKWLDDNKVKLDEVISKVKNEKIRDYLNGYVKLLGKYCNDELKETELDEAKKANDGHILPIMKGIFKILKIVLGCGVLGIAGISFGISKLSGAIDGIGKKLGNKLMESLTLEVADDEELKEKEDAEELAEDGCSVKEADEEEKEEVNEADDREPASHLLDAVGVKASTANLKAQDTAMISVVEMLLKKIDKLEARLDEACKSKKLNEGEADLPDGPDKWDFDDEGMTAEDKKNYEEAVKIQDASYRRELTKAEEDKFRKLLDKLPDVAKDHLLSNTMGPNGFARPGDVPPISDPTVHPDDGGGNGMGGFGKAKIDFDKKVPIPPFNYKQGSHRPSSAEERKAAKELEKKEEEKRRLAARFPARGKKDPNGEKGLWSGKEWESMVRSLDPKEKKEILNSMIDELRAEGKEQGKDPRQVASEVAYVKEHFGEKLNSRDLAQMLYGLTDFDDIEKKRVGIDKYARTVMDIIIQAFKDENDPKKVAELIDANLNTLRNSKRAKNARTPLIRGDNPLDKDGEGLIDLVKSDKLANMVKDSETEEIEEADDLISAEEFFSNASESEKEESKEEENKETK